MLKLVPRFLFLAVPSLLLGFLSLSAPAADAAVPKIVLEMEGNLDDSSGNALVTSAKGGACFFVSDGVSGKALRLDGTGYLELPFGLLADSANFSVDFWFRTTSHGGLLGYQSTAYPHLPSEFVPIIAVESDGHLRTEMLSSANSVSISSTQAVNDGNWHRVVLSADVGHERYQVYLDGVLLGTAAATIQHLDMYFNQLGVVNGKGDASRAQLVQGWDFFEGDIDQFVLYAEAVPTSEVIKTPQFISFTAPSDQLLSAQSIQLLGSSSSSLTLSYSSATPSVCRVSDATVQLLSGGTCTVLASQEGDASYSAASAVSHSFDIMTPAISLNVPADIAVDATGLFSRIELGEATAHDAAGVALQATHTGGSLFKPGRHQVTWRVVDASGTAREEIQQVDVRPLVNFQNNQTTSEGTTLQVDVVLNGESPVYPLSIGYTVGGSSDSNDQDLVSGNLVIVSGLKGRIEVHTLGDSIVETYETIILTLVDSPEVNVGVASQHVITITEENVAPVGTIQVVQNNQERQIVDRQGGQVKIISDASDPNQGQILHYDWSSSDNELANSSTDPTQFIFDPSSLDLGVYSVVLVVRDDDVPGLTRTVSSYVNVVQALPILEENKDSDGDGILDTVEGLSDADRDGIPNYLDNIEQCNVLPQQLGNSSSHLIEADRDVCMRLGNLAMNGETGGSQIIDDGLESGDVRAFVPDTAANNVGGLFDFHVTDLPLAGQSVHFVVPQRIAIPENAIYRLLIDGAWQDFSENSSHALRSATGQPGYCPPVVSDQWTDGLTVGDWCVQLTVVDGDINDVDGRDNHAVVSFGGVAVLVPGRGAVKDTRRIKITGGAMGWWGLLTLATYGTIRRKSLHPVITVTVFFLFLLSINPTVVEASQVAQPEIPSAVQIKPSWYGALMIGSFEDDASNASLQRQFDALGSGAQVVSSDTQRLGFELAAGYQLQPHISAELALINLANVNVIVDMPIDTTSAEIETATAIHPQSAWGVAASVRGDMPLREGVSLLAKLGLWGWKAKFLALDPQGEKLATDRFGGSDLLASVGLLWQLSKSDTSIAFDHSWIMLDEATVGGFRLGVLKHF